MLETAPHASQDPRPDSFGLRGAVHRATDRTFWFVSSLLTGCFEAAPLPQDPACFGSCAEPRCGDGTVDDDEECDDGDENDDHEPGACRTDCTRPYCGDGVHDPEEACDEGSMNGKLGELECSEECTLPSCEECSSGEGDTSSEGEDGEDDEPCAGECERPNCGDGSVDEGEECDGSENCTHRCQKIACGNNRVDEGIETCEPPGVGLCGSDCRIIECGDGVIQDGEECDPPRDGACSSSCQEIECGNDRIDEGEGCDPPRSGECDNACRPLGCGDGTISGDEECDPPESGHCDGGCRTIECGNSRLEENEECDPPSMGTCNDECHNIQCGDGVIDQTEQCDPPAAGTCNHVCQTIDCGDGRVDEGEQCEPSTEGGDRCSDACTEIDEDTGAEVIYGFDADLQGWYIRETSPEFLEEDSALTHDAQNGSQTPGTARLFTPFSDSNQKIEVQADRAIDLSGRTLTVRVRLQSGLGSDAQHPGGIKLFAKSGADYRYASGEWVELRPGGGWSDVSLVGDAPILDPDGYSPADVRQIGFELRSFEETTDVSEAVMFFDTVTLHD